MKNNIFIEGTKGTIELNQPWDPGKEGGPYNSKIKININKIK